MVTLVIATRNTHKLGEIRVILGPGFEYVSLRDLPGAPEIVEDAPTFEGNAVKKAVALASFLAQRAGTASSPPGSALGSPPGPVSPYVLADDSGLEVDVLNGAPGVHSARFAAVASGRKGNSSDTENNARLLALLASVPWEKRTARFRCVIALSFVPQLTPGGAPASGDELELQPWLFQGTCEGRIDFTPRGQGGFGYDPLFIPNGYDESFAQLGPEIKNGLSHRARALASLKKALSSTLQK